ncbi:MAG TPA: hypothetical protein VNZ94_05305 [Xanthobacteraceae bacterium]|nr:hypothetical protein [Xanthobacteraceae bacterium]
MGSLDRIAGNLPEKPLWIKGSRIKNYQFKYILPANLGEDRTTA